MPLNFDEGRRTSPGTGRSAIADDLLDELTSWPPRDRVGMFKQWQRGSLSLVHLHVLAQLEALGPLTMSRLAEVMDVSDASATGIVDRMERNGFVERRHATDDRRLVVVQLTSRGANVFRAINAHRRKRLARVLSELSEDELGGFLIGIRAMRAARERLFGANESEQEPSDGEDQPAAEPPSASDGAEAADRADGAKAADQAPALQ